LEENLLDHWPRKKADGCIGRLSEDVFGSERAAGTTGFSGGKCGSVNK
jgi:hypothetical protein